MKRLSLLVLFFYACTFAHPSRTHANPVVIGLIPPGVIGSVILVLGGTYIAQSQNGGYAIDNDRLYRDMVAFRKYVQDGAEIALGTSTTAALNLADLIQSGVIQGYQSLAQWLDGYFNPVPFPGHLDNANLACTAAQSAQCTPGKVAHLTLSSVSRAGGWTDAYKSTGLAYGDQFPKWGVGGSTYTTVEDFHKYGTWWYWWMSGYSVSYVDGVVDPEPGVPDVINPELEKALAKDLAAAVAANPAISAALDQVMQDHPDLWAFPPTAPVTPADVANWAQGQGTAAQQTYIDALEDMVAQNPTDTALQAELARAKAEQAKAEADQVKDQAEQEQDNPTFPPIAANPFAAPYAPGAFDIPARFTTFMNTVKSSGLFSFSSAFFNSLPGGGSPVYEIEAGQYGHHTIDLSQTMAAGLSVLKTVLMLCFGFLSIRAVIMKR